MRRGFAVKTDCYYQGCIGWQHRGTIWLHVSWKISSSWQLVATLASLTVCSVIGKLSWAKTTQLTMSCLALSVKGSGTFVVALLQRDDRIMESWRPFPQSTIRLWRTIISSAEPLRVRRGCILSMGQWL